MSPELAPMNDAIEAEIRRKVIQWLRYADEDMRLARHALTLATVNNELCAIGQTMKLQEKIIESFIKMDQFKFATWKPTEYNEIEARRDVEETLLYHYPKQTFATVFKNQLTELHWSGVVELCNRLHPYEPHEIYLTMERIISGEIQHKPFTNKCSKLFNKNLFHAHHSETFYIGMNCIRYFKRHFKDDSSILTRLAEIQREYPLRTDHVVIFANEVLMNSVNWQYKTGEWIVYQKNEGNFHFLCLYVHDHDGADDSKLYALIKNELRGT